MIYEYQCPLCGEQKEVIQKLNDPPPTCAHPHPMDGEMEDIEMVKLISLSSFSLKGHGWARDGYKK
jgi:putative FmdB family regulatory protein